VQTFHGHFTSGLAASPPFPSSQSSQVGGGRRQLRRSIQELANHAGVHQGEGDVSSAALGAIQLGEGCHPKNPNVSPKTRCRLNLVKGDCCRNANTIDWIFVACDYVESERCFFGSMGQIWTDQVAFSNLSTALVGFRHKLEGAIRDNTDAVAKVLTQDTAAPSWFNSYMDIHGCLW